MVDYWKSRNDEMENIISNMNSDREYEQKLYTKYDEAFNEIEREIQADISRFATREGLSMDEANKLITKHEVEAFQEKAKKYVKEKDFSPRANQELRLYNVTMRTNRMEYLKQNIRLEMIALADEETKMALAKDVDVVESEIKRQAGILGESVPSQSELRSLAETVAYTEYDNHHFSESIWRNTHDVVDEIDHVVRGTILRGEHPYTAVPRMLAELEIVKNGKDSDVVGGAKYKARRVAITEAARAQTSAQKKAFDQFGTEQYEFIAEPDACSDCAELDGETFNVADMQPGENAAPMHPFCRCSTAAVADRAGLEERLEEIERLEAEDQEEYEMLEEQVGEFMLGSLEEFQQVKYNDSEQYNFIQQHFDRVRNSGLIGTRTTDDIEISEVKPHFFEQLDKREMTLESVKDTIANPAHITRAKRDSMGRLGKKYIGMETTVTVNPEHQAITTTYPTNRKNRRRYGGENQ